MATGARALWKGATSFGLVHIPIALHPATGEHNVHFDWLDERSMDSVGYKRINKKTGKEIDKTHFVKGVKVDGGDYVLLSEDEIRAAYPQSTQSMVAVGPALVLNLLRWGADIGPWDDLHLPADGVKDAKLSDAELKMAAQLVGDMTTSFKPEDCRDSFEDEVMALLHRKVESGNTEAVIQPESGESPAKSADVIDLTDWLRRSLKGGKAEPADESSRRTAKPATKKTMSPARRKRRAA